MAERVFASKLKRIGFVEVRVGNHVAFGIHEAALYPLFTPQVIDVMRRTIPRELQGHVANGVIVEARKPDARPSSRSGHERA